MDYDEFVKLRHEGRISAGVDTSRALRLIDHLPKRYRAAQIFWSWVWMLSIPAFICVSVFYKWWLGLILLVVVTPLIFSAVKKAAANFVLEHATENRAFFELLVQNGLLAFREHS